jgi:hypothetical protein
MRRDLWSLDFLDLIDCDFDLWESWKGKVYITNLTKKGHSPRDFHNFRAKIPDSKLRVLSVY